MKLSFLGPAPPLRGGIVTYIAMLYRVLAGRGHDIFWAAFRKRLKEEHIPESFSEITSKVEGFMKPIIQGKPSGINWLPTGPWS